MSSSRKQHGNIHRIREFELEKVNLSDEFDILQIVGEGWFGKILLVEHRGTDTEMVLKALPKPYVSLRDFYREFHYGLHLGAHKNIVTTYDVAFETAGFYVFTQEYAPLGDLTSNVSDIGIGELHTKRVAKQIASALDYIHAKDLVHRDVKLDNVLVCRSDFSRVKLCDFGETRKSGSYVQRRNEWLPYSPPEVLLINTDNNYRTVPSHDIWQFAIVLFVCLTGCLPWQKAASDDPRYVRYLVWQNSTMVIPIKRTPKLFKLLTTRACKMFRRFLEPQPERRPKNLSDLHKFLDDRWLAKGAEKDMIANEPDELCASMYSFHSSPEEKNKLLYALAQHGIETTVDRVAKKERIRDWIQQSVIQEDDEEEQNDDGKIIPNSIMARAPIAGHVSSVRAEEKAAAKKRITTTIKDASNKHIDPRTGRIQKGPSEMGHRMDQQQPFLAQTSDLLQDNSTVEQNGAYQNGIQHHIDDYNGSKHQKMVDVGSQTSTESQKLNEMKSNESDQLSKSSEAILLSKDDKHAGSRQQAQKLQSKSANNIANTQMSKKSINENNPTSRGLMLAFNSIATVAVPETQKDRDRSQNYHLQRHHTTALIKNIQRSSNSPPGHNVINDSGYGSLDKLKSMDGNTMLSSPILSKRSIVQSSFVSSHPDHNNFTKQININGLSHQNSRERNQFDSDSGGEGSPRGSTGFVNLVGNTVVNVGTMKDSAYDRIKPRQHHYHHHHHHQHHKQ